ncbi:receptor-like protein 9DC1 [Lycium ferocissimum]|uniref:receptor-like protein 9DC1 n=1 Tax=Lycium ferocissimum TaxID=112874 RepID=UPI002815952E|nr:receptor-like protein 9DC1 [Lycium ferocissimum]
MSWNRSMNRGRWDGVTCDRFTGHVTGLDLNGKNLEGTIHPNSSIFQLCHIQMLDLSLNNFWGSQIPPSIGELASLMHLNLSHSMFEGRIPLKISHLSKLVLLDLFSLYSNFQSSREGFNMLFRNLTKLELESKIPDAFSNFQKLTHLGLHINNFTGPFPSSLMNLTKLEVLCLNDNSLNGPLPFSANELQNLKYVDLSRNSLNESIPSWMLSLPSLSDLHLEYNNFSGPFPEFKTNSMEHLYLSQNQLSGPIPHSLRDLVNLTYLSLGSNNLSCEVGAETFSTMKKIYNLDLSYSG